MSRPPRRRRLPRPYLTRTPSPAGSPPAAEAPSPPLLHRVLSGLRALPDAAPRPSAPPAPPAAGWKCPAAECLWESINPMPHACPFPPCAAHYGTAALAVLTRRLLARDPSLGAPSEQREPSPDAVVTQELPVVSADGGGR